MWKSETCQVCFGAGKRSRMTAISGAYGYRYNTVYDSCIGCSGNGYNLTYKSENDLKREQEARIAINVLNKCSTLLHHYSGNKKNKFNYHSLIRYNKNKYSLVQHYFVNYVDLFLHYMYNYRVCDNF